MKWKKLSLATTTDAEDLVSGMLNDLGISSIEIEDHIPITEEEKKAMFIDILPELPPDDKKAVISFYLGPEEDTYKVILEVKKGLAQLENFVNIGEGTIQISETEDKDWINNWKQFFKPFRVDDSIVIKPTWEELKECSKEDLVIEIDPGTAFGTGSHETTRLCIQALKKYVDSSTRLLDVGCGSGILSIIGLKLGAEKAVGTDIDSAAIIASRENAEVNKISEEQFEIYNGNIITDSSFQEQVGYDYSIVTANILADIIIPLSGEIGKHLKKGGLFITSGIINTKSEEVKKAISDSGFEIIEISTMGDWVSVTARKQNG